MSATGEVGSPCIKVCTLDSSGRICLGCLRTTAEIAAWGSLTNAERGRVVGSLPERHRLRMGQAVKFEPRQCSRCGTAFGCGANGLPDACWCTRYPPMTPQAGATCLCPACLAAATN